ncbi:hypothetical protein FJT64_014052 [Amphibalanus amphitrite]|uniref:Transposable element P transposase-like RNase H domain-containing protein n=2 Tax=Amphibalanus amphitrite TaxID=1232801 RepID=A0A6A4V1R1_AMPAM|nr:hypothetical protein FJT64_014052 [Amphibalanus amphitrite]
MKLGKEKLPSGYTIIKMCSPEQEDYVLTIRLEELDETLGLPIIKRNLTVYRDLRFRMHAASTEMSLRHVAGLTARPGIFQSTAEVLNVLARLKSLQPCATDLKCAAAELIERAVAADRNDGLNVCQFAAEQLRLSSVPPNRRRYSQTLMSLAVVWDRTSPKLYQDLCHSGVLILPHKTALRRLTSALSVREGLEAGTVQYLKMRIAKLNARERLVNLAMDEVHTARAVELAGGRLYGDSKDGVTNTIFCTLISSVAGRYEDIITMSPVPSITTEAIREIFFKVLKTLTEIGFSVVSCTTDGHRTNQSFHNGLGTDGEHPEWIINPYSTDGARVYTMYDSVHLFKNFYNNLLNKKTLECPPMPGTKTPLHAASKHLEQLYLLEREEYRAFQGTADFLELLRQWFSVVNVKTAFTYVRLRDPLRTPPSNEERGGLNFLVDFQKMLQTWLDRKGGTKMSRDTTQAAIYTCRGLVGLANYLLDKHSDVMKYVLLGKVQSDRIEGRFGYLRKLAGGNYWASVRQFLEGEAVVRVKSLVWLSGYSLGTVTAQMEEAQKLRQREDDAVIDMLVVAASCADYNGQLTEGTEQAIAHVAGYLARSVTKKHVCESCHELLVNRGQGPLKNMRLEEDSEPMDGSGPGLMDAVKTFTELLNRGGLLCPSELAVHVTTDMYLMYRWLVQDEETRYALFGCSKPRAAFQKVAAVISQEDTRHVIQFVMHGAIKQ